MGVELSEGCLSGGDRLARGEGRGGDRQLQLAFDFLGHVVCGLVGSHRLPPVLVIDVVAGAGGVVRAGDEVTDSELVAGE